MTGSAKRLAQRLDAWRESAVSKYPQPAERLAFIAKRSRLRFCCCTIRSSISCYPEQQRHELGYFQSSPCAPTTHSPWRDAEISPEYPRLMHVALWQAVNSRLTTGRYATYPSQPETCATLLARGKRSGQADSHWRPAIWSLVDRGWYYLDVSMMTSSSAANDLSSLTAPPAASLLAPHRRRSRFAEKAAARKSRSSIGFTCLRHKAAGRRIHNPRWVWLYER